MLAYMLLESKVKKQYFGVFSPLTTLNNEDSVLFFFAYCQVSRSHKRFF
jgi:hypothetical protein